MYRQIDLSVQSIVQRAIMKRFPNGINIGNSADVMEPRYSRCPMFLEIPESEIFSQSACKSFIESSEMCARNTCKYVKIIF